MSASLIETKEEQVEFDLMIKKTAELKSLLNNKIIAADEESWRRVGCLIKGMGGSVNGLNSFIEWAGGKNGCFKGKIELRKNAKTYEACVGIEGGFEAIRNEIKGKIDKNDGNVSFYLEISEPERHREIPLSKIISLIKHGDENLRTQSKHIKKRVIAGACGAEIKELKARLLPVASFNGVFEPGKKITNASFIRSSGVFCIDIDKITDQVVLEASKEEICRFESVMACFISPSGTGIKVLMSVDPDYIKNDAEFKHAYDQFEQYFRLLGYDIDEACKDIRRACYLTYDEDVYYNPAAKPFNLTEYVESEAVTSHSISNGVSNGISSGFSTGISTGISSYSNNDRGRDEEAIRLFNICASILLRAVDGSRHQSRLKAGKLFGGFVSSGQLPASDYEKLLRVSDIICGSDDGGVTNKEEAKALMDGYNQGLGMPIAKKEGVGIDVDVDDFNIDDVQDWVASPSSSIDYIIPFPSVARDIQQFILSNSIYPQPAFAYAAAMAVVGTCVGRNLRYTNLKGNMMFIGMLESGEGKDHPFKMAKKILKAVGLENRVESKCASGAALFEALEANPSLLLHIDEYGHYMDGINGKGANVYAKEIVTIMTEAYTSSSDELVGKRTKGGEPIRIEEPNLSVFGMSTERQIFDGLRSSDVADGSLARYMMLFGTSGLRHKRLHYSQLTAPVPEGIINSLKKLIEDNKYNVLSSRQVEILDKFDDAKHRLNDDLQDMYEKSSFDLKFKPFYRRIVVRATQVSLLIDKCQSVEVFEWARDLELATLKVFIKKFNHLSADNENERMYKMIENMIKESGKKGILKKDLTNKTRQVQTYMRKQIIAELIDDGAIFEEKKKIGKSPRASSFYYWRK